MLGRDDPLPEDVALMNRRPEEGCLGILDVNLSTTAFTKFGVESLKELLANLGPDTQPKWS